MGQEKELLDSVLSEERGTPQNEHLKKKSKEKEERKRLFSDQKKFYTESNGKLLFITCKANGAYSSYVGKTEKMKDYVAKLKKDGMWIDGHAAQEYTSKAVAELASNLAGKKSKGK